jgi:surfactin synthase thioesterase subunit
MLSPWLRRFQPTTGAATRLVCLPHAGGAASFYFPMAKALAPKFDVLAVQYPGRQDRLGEPVPGTIGGYADEVVEALRTLDDRPTALFGHSTGAAVGFEVALRLQALGRTPVRLFASGRRAPSRTRDEHVHKGSDAQFIAQLRHLAGTNAKMLADAELLTDPDLMPVILPAIRADYQAIETYRPTPGGRVACPVTVLTGDSDPQVTAEEADAWRECVTGPVELREYQGGHFFLVDHAADITTLIAERLGVATP